MIKSKFWTPDRIVTIFAISISLFTLIVFARQTSIIEKQSLLSVMPYLNMETGNNPDNDFITLTLNNYGVGPSIIDEVKIFYEGKTYEIDFTDFLRIDSFQKDSVAVLASASIDKGLAIPQVLNALQLNLVGQVADILKRRSFCESSKGMNLTMKSFIAQFMTIGGVFEGQLTSRKNCNN